MSDGIDTLDLVKYFNLKMEYFAFADFIVWLVEQTEPEDVDAFIHSHIDHYRNPLWSVEDQDANLVALRKVIDKRMALRH